jgi:hypothetical protein
MTQLKEILEAYRNKQREFPSYGELMALATAPAAPNPWKSLADKAIDILQRNIVPDGISDHDAISELLEVFDGPEYRAIGDVAQLDCDMRQSQAMSESKAVETLSKVGSFTAPHWYDCPQSALGGKTAREGYAANPAYADPAISKGD